MRPALLAIFAGGLLLAGLAVTPALSTAQTPPAQPAPEAKPSMEAKPSTETKPSMEAKPPADDFDSQKALADLQKAIAGKEEQPAETVFKDVQIFKGVPAGRLLGAMNSFTKALGVTCKKCHDPENWASDAKEEKKSARGMMQMTKDINVKYLQTMTSLDKDASVNCGTCHRGHANPADGMRPPAAPSH